MDYYIKKLSSLHKAPCVLKTKHGYISNPSAKDYASIGAYPRNDASLVPPSCGRDEIPNAVGWELKDGEWVKLWKVEPIVHTEADYDAAMEDYLRSVRSERGYTTREPDDYFGSSNPRWSQDAKDWVAFRDAVMTYALDVINTYTATGNAPTLAEFKAGFPKMVWTYQEEV